MPTLDSKVRDHVSKEEIVAALALLKEHLPTISQKKRNMILLLESQWNGNENKFLSGLRSEESYNREVARIKLAVLNQIPRNATQIELEEEEPESTSVDNPPKVNPSPDFGNKKVYFSYSWKNDINPDLEVVVDEMYKSLIAAGFPIIRDVVDLGYGEDIDLFMEQLGDGDLVMVFISDKYIRSEYSMFELNEIGQNNRMNINKVIKRLLPVRVEEIDLSGSGFREYREHWTKLKRDWELNVTDGQASLYEMRQFDRVRSIQMNIGELLGLLRRINARTLKLLKENDFAEVKAAIQSRLTS